MLLEYRPEFPTHIMIERAQTAIVRRNRMNEFIAGMVEKAKVSPQRWYSFSGILQC